MSARAEPVVRHIESGRAMTIVAWPDAGLSWTQVERLAHQLLIEGYIEMCEDPVDT
jgi:hypothetical protein